jgi:predicted outer membrane lipoprotein
LTVLVSPNGAACDVRDHFKILDLIGAKIGQIDLERLDLILAAFGLITALWSLYVVFLQIRMAKRREKKDLRDILGSASQALKAKSKS